MTTLEAFRTVLQAILIECEKGNIEAIKDMASHALQQIEEKKE